MGWRRAGASRRTRSARRRRLASRVAAARCSRSQCQRGQATAAWRWWCRAWSSRPGGWCDREVWLLVPCVAAVWLGGAWQPVVDGAGASRPTLRSPNPLRSQPEPAAAPDPAGHTPQPEAQPIVEGAENMETGGDDGDKEQLVGGGAWWGLANRPGARRRDLHAHALPCTAQRLPSAVVQNRSSSAAPLSTTQKRPCCCCCC